MEKLVRIKQQGTLSTFQGANSGETVTKIEVVMTDGIDTFVAEAFDKQAIAINQNPLDPNAVYNAQLQISMREWSNQQTGVTNRANSIRIIKIAAV